MSGSMLVRGLVVGLALAILTVPAAFADDPPTTTETTTTTTTPTTTESTTTAETTTTAQAEAPPPDPWAETPETRALLRQAVHYRRIARRWLALMGRLAPHVYPPATPFESLLARRQWLAGAWRGKAVRARLRAAHPPHRAAWLCIQGYEGSWRDPYPPYYGGFQMDLTFQRQYGARLLRWKGTANRLDGARADVGGGAGAASRPGLLSVAGERAPLRSHLGGLSTANGSVTSRPCVRKR